MNENEIRYILENDGLLLLKGKVNDSYLYSDKYRMLIPIQQEVLAKEYNINVEIKALSFKLYNIPLKKELLRAHHAKLIFQKLMEIPEMEKWKLSSSLWFVENEYAYVHDFPTNGVVYNGKTQSLEMIGNRRARVLRVIYLQGKKIMNQDKTIFYGELNKYGLSVADQQVFNIKFKKEQISKDIRVLLDCDYNRCGLASYEKKMLYDIKAGHWDVFENPELCAGDEKLVARDPKQDIKRNGVIGIDFGTKNTVVVKQEGSNGIIPIRIGSLSLKSEVVERDYENPTVISCISLDSFLKSYNEKEGRPETSCEDLFVSYTAYEKFKEYPPEYFYAYYSDLKQWANGEKEDAVVQDIKEMKKYRLGENNSIEESYLNPIEIYAYYIGLYINNMRNGIYMKYMMSFPVKYSKETKELIRKSFEKGLKKSLPASIVADMELMSSFSVQYQISEPAAYAATALEQTGFKPKNEKEQYLYGIFDFGGGTADFDFGVWRGASDDEYEKYNCDYVMECFGADSDARLGGENILEMLAYHVFKQNKLLAEERRLTCALPVDEVAFIGSENLLNNSRVANRNLTLLKEELRPLWEQHEGWKEKYIKKNSGMVSEDGTNKLDECINVQLYNIDEIQEPNCELKIDTQQLLELIVNRIRKGVDAFFNCIEKSILGNKSAQFASEKVYIFLAGNSSKSKFVKEIFQETIDKYNKEYGSIVDKKQDRFELIDSLKVMEADSEYVPNIKTGVAFGLLKSRPGGNILVKKNYETDSNEETRFKYYLGGNRRGVFNCKLTPMIKNADGENVISYNVWHKFQGAGVGTVRIYYTEDPRADSKAESLDINNIPFHEITFEPEEDKYVFIRAVKPAVIEYTVAASEDQIEGQTVELDIDHK